MWLRFLFWLKSSNEHGVHSPFVFKYLTQGIYYNKLKNRNKSFQWLEKSLMYFQPKSIYCDFNFQATLKSNNLVKHTDVSNADILIFKVDTRNYLFVLASLKVMTSEQMALIVWQKYPDIFLHDLRENQEITLVIDFFYGAFVSKRKQQLKQNFYLRS